MQSVAGDGLASPDSFFPTASLERLRERAAIIRRVREFFESRGFLEVETPVLSRDTVVDRYLEPFAVPVGGDQPFYLQTSPEFAMKRMIAAGANAIFQIGRVFRRGDFGQMHNPEFTMLEWYRTGDDYEAGVALLSDLADAVLQRGKANVVTFRQLFAEHIGLNPHTADCGQLRDYAIRSGIAFPESFGLAEHDRENWVDLIFSERIQASNFRFQASGEGVETEPEVRSPKPEARNPVIVIDYLATQSQLAQTRRIIDASGEFDVSERFELFVDGLELANGYHELLDANVLLERIRLINALRIADGNAPLPEESRLLDAMRHGLPPCCGCAMGLDRLVMAALQTRNIADVIAFPWDRA
ncbi:MAG: EF-P lysine aminoacylase GenX [Planctomycetaceae bacterium]|nr:EF-P lysine aminoacylase GenX [Planctomycetaceae bacterium]